MRFTSLSTLKARNVISSRFPMGVETKYKVLDKAVALYHPNRGLSGELVHVECIFNKFAFAIDQANDIEPHGRRRLHGKALEI